MKTSLNFIQVYRFETTLCYIFGIKFSISFNSILLVPLRLSFYKNSSCRALSKIFEITKAYFLFTLWGR